MEKILREEYNPGNFLNYPQKTLLDIAERYIDEMLQYYDEDEVHSIRIMLTGSRLYGTHTPHSDIDIVVEYQGTAREDSLHEALNGEHLYIEGVKVDFIPIRVDKSGTLEEWMEREVAYRKSFKKKKDGGSMNYTYLFFPNPIEINEFIEEVQMEIERLKGEGKKILEVLVLPNCVVKEYTCYGNCEVAVKILFE